MEDVESDARQGEGEKERASSRVLKRAKSSADCCDLQAKEGRGQEQ